MSVMISVVIYSYKNKSYLLQSLVTLSQQDCEWEAIVIDDGLSLGRLDIPPQDRERVRIIGAKKPVGFLRSLLMGMSLVRGDHCVIQRGCDAHASDRLSFQSKLLKETGCYITFDVPRFLVDSGTNKVEELDLSEDSCFRSSEEIYKITQKWNDRAFGCISGFMFVVNAFNMGLLYRRTWEEQGKPSLTYAVNTFYSCLPRDWCYQSSRGLPIVNCKHDVDMYETNDYRRILSYRK